MKQERKSILESVLAKQMAPVKAPDALWQRIKNPQAREQRGSIPVGSMWPQWAAAATALVIVGGIGVGIGWVRNLEQKPSSPEAIAVAALADEREALSLRTHDTGQIRTWVKTNSGIDIPLPPKHSSVIQVVGTRMIDGPRPFAEVAYEVGGYRATLLVAKDPSGKKTYPSHGFHPSDRLDAARVTSWSMRGQSYTLAWEASEEEFEVACLLCHDQKPTLPSAARKL